MGPAVLHTITQDVLIYKVNFKDLSYLLKTMDKVVRVRQPCVVTEILLNGPYYMI